MQDLQYSKIIEHMLSRPSPIRQIMKMADPKNIINLGLDLDEFISFGGGWVNHLSPEAVRNRYIDACSDKETFHKLGAYSPTAGEEDCRTMLAECEKEIFGMNNITCENIIIGQSSTQITHDMLLTLLNPGDDVIFFDPTYANYFGQLYFAIPDAKVEVKTSGLKVVVPTIEIGKLKVLDTDNWEYLANPSEVIEGFNSLVDTHNPKMVLFPSPDNPTSQIQSQAFVKEILDICLEKGIYVAIDFAYKTQHFDEPPEYYSYSPEDHPDLIGLHSNSKWGRGLGRRLGWMEASKGVIDAMERTQQCTILCPDSLHQYVLTSYLKESLPDGGLRDYLDEARMAYKTAAEVTTKAIDQHLGFRRLNPQGGLYTVMDVGSPSEKFVEDVMKNTGVLFVPGAGFGDTLKNAVRVSYGPLVRDTERITEGFERVGEYLRKKG
jgi:aspartate/methionine/tyrosine aminotransferase